MGEREAERWREFYWAAVLEEDSNHIPERLDTAHAAIKARLKVLPHGLDDLKEMREIDTSLRRLARLRRRVSRRQPPTRIAVDQKPLTASASPPPHEASSNALMVIDLSSWNGRLTVVAGGLLCTALLALLNFLLKSNSALEFLPFIGLASIVLIGLRLGALAGVMGSVIAALILAVLVPPAGRFAIKDAALRESILWMVLGGVALSYLLLPFHSSRARGSKPV